jgi:hypothetical protein
MEELQVPITPSAASDISRSRSASPVVASMQEQDTKPLVIAEPSSVLMGKTVSPPSSPPPQTGPSALEQNMAFAALQVVMSPCVGGSILPEKRTSAHLVDQPDVDTIRPVKRKLGT